ncbi:hypothetical protein BGW37DRAFT_419623 [Umbelopsis sp. PMI_123]|nr:hypothetical protein BGW37DRAFT_419623 [Umbelopsis sp. PMI_123]
MLTVPRRKGRSRGSSVSTTNSLDLKSSTLSRSNSNASRILPKHLRKDSDDTDVDDVSEGGYSAAAGSIAGACGMELANAKRNNDYHALFRSVPEDDVLIEGLDISTIMHQAYYYLVIAFTEIVAIEKRLTAKIIPNAIQISTLHSKHLFASFLSRDQAYDQLIDIWHVAHPNLNNRTLSAKVDGIENGDIEHDEDDDSEYSYEEYTSSSYYDSDEYTETLPLPPIKTEEKESRRRAMSELPSRPNPKFLLKSKGMDTPNDHRTMSPADMTADKANVVAPQPVKHAPTECACSKNKEHYPGTALDETYTGTLETINNLLFNSGFEKRFLTENQKSTDVNIGPWEKGQGDVQFVRESNYIKYLGGSIGPKTTKCILKDEVIHFDLDDYITQVTTTQTPDVPSGSTFCVKTRTCLTWAGDNKVRILVTFAVEFTKNGWLKCKFFFGGCCAFCVYMEMS